MLKKIMRNKYFNLRLVFILVAIILMFLVVGTLYSSRTSIVKDGIADLSDINFEKDKTVILNGQWEFYWNKLLSPEDFSINNKPQMDSFINVPGAWSNEASGMKSYPKNGVATYVLHLKYPASLKDPALRIQHISTAYRLYANDKLITEVGSVSKSPLEFKDGEKLVIVKLPTDSQEVKLVFQVASLNYAGSGLRLSPIFGSEKLLERQSTVILTQQIFLIGCVSIFSLYYLLLFLLQRKNKTALVFSIICFITAFRSLVWGEMPLTIFFPDAPFDTWLFINYLTGYNIMPAVVLFILSNYPTEFNKKISWIILLPNLFFDLLLLTTTAFMSNFTNYIYILIFVQMIFGMSVLIKAVLKKRDNALILFSALCVFYMTMVQDILYYKGIGGINLSYMFLYGNFVVIIAMSYMQAKQQSDNYKKLVLYNEKLIEADKLRDKIEATELSFLQAQIKPHFLYNALSAIANVCEMDGKRAGNLIIDLALYLRRSLEFNSLYKMSTIEKELEFVDNYFNIEQARFGQKIKLLKEIEVSLDYLIPVFILQPLVENAVRHGISKKLEGGTVIITMFEENEAISIEIKDDGVGIDNEILKMLLDDAGKDKRVGLINIHNRLLRLYGSGLKIESQVRQGTCVRIVIPKEGV